MGKDNVIELKNHLPGETDPINSLIQQGARQLIAQAVEAELEELLSVYQDKRLPDGRASVVRNGYLPERPLQTGIGPVPVKVPKVRSRSGEPVVFHSSLVPPYVRKTRSLESALPWLYLKGISTGEMDDALKVLVGPESSGLSASVVSRLKRQWAEDYTAWNQRRLDKDRWVYLWADGIYSGLRSEEVKLCALVIMGVNDRGEKHFLAIEDGTRESTQSWREVLLKLKARGMNTAQLAVGDGSLGFWAALDEVYPKTRHQRCWVHKIRNVLNALPKSSQPKAKRALQEIWQAENKALAEQAFDLFITTYEAKYPKATRKLVKDRDHLLMFYDYPALHWQSLRTTNPIESTFGTLRHRTKRAKGCLSRDGMLHMLFKLGQAAEKNWKRFRGFNSLAQVIEGVIFKDGMSDMQDDQRAASN